MNDENVRRLRELMALHGLTRKRVSELCEVSERTVDSWLAPVGASSHRRMPGRNVEFLELRLRGKRKGKKR